MFFESFSDKPFNQILIFLDKPLEIADWQVTGMNTIALFALPSVTNKTFFLHH
jgi:hypothetical protein